MPTIGADCDIILYHNRVDSGAQYGFIIEAKHPRYGSPVEIHHTVKWDDTGTAYTDERQVWFTVLISDDLVNPDGSKHDMDAATMQEKLLSILLQHEDINLITANGVITGLRTSGLTYIESVFSELVTITIQLTTSLANAAIIPYDDYIDSLWVDELTYSGSRTWSNSYWRT